MIFMKFTFKWTKTHKGKFRQYMITPLIPSIVNGPLMFLHLAMLDNALQEDYDMASLLDPVMETDCGSQAVDPVTTVQGKDLCGSRM